MNFIEEGFNLNENEKREALNLNDEDSVLNDEFLFNKKNFNTIILEKQRESNVQQVLDVEKFIQQYQNPSEKEDLLVWLKTNNYKNLLIDEIKNTQDKEILRQLIAAYWEAGFTDNKDLLVFVPYLMHEDFYLALEAYTAILMLSKPFIHEDTQKALDLLESSLPQASTENHFMITEIIKLLQQQLSNE